MLPAFLQEAGRAGRDGCAAVVVACVERLGEGPPRLPRQRTPQAEQLAQRPPWLEKGPRLCPRRGPAPTQPSPPSTKTNPCSPVRPDPAKRGATPRWATEAAHAAMSLVALQDGSGRAWDVAGRLLGAAAAVAQKATGPRAPPRAPPPPPSATALTARRPPLAPLSPTAPALGCRRAARTAGGGAGGAVEPRRARLGVGAPDHRGAAGAWRHRPAGRRCRRRRRHRCHRSRAGWPAGASAPPPCHRRQIMAPRPCYLGGKTRPRPPTHTHSHPHTPPRRRSTCSRFPPPATGRCTPRCRMR